MDCVYNRVLHEIGDENKYQKRFDIVYNTILILFWSMAYTNIIMVLAITPHVCKIPEKPENISEQDWKIIHIPRYEDVNGQMKFDSCLIFTNPYENNNTKACDEYTFDNTWYDKTVPSEYNWVCDKEIYVFNILGYSKIGEIIGSVFFGWLGDVYGRRYTYIVSITMLVLGRFISLVAGNSYLFFVIGGFISYLPSWSAPQSLSVISLEMSSARRRTVVSSLRFMSFSVGLCVLGLSYWLIRDWKIFFIVTTAPLIPFIIMSWKMVESPRWLYTRGRVAESLKQLKKIAKVNKKKIDTNTENDLLNVSLGDKPQVFGILTLFSVRRLAFYSILLVIICMATTLSYLVLIISSGQKSDGNPFLDFIWQALVEIPSFYLSGWLADYFGRRYTGLSSVAVTAIMWTSIVIRENCSGGWIRLWWIGTLLSLIARLSTNVTFFVCNLLNMELYPTCLRQTGMSLANIVSGIAAAMSPYVVYLGRQIDPRLPGIILTIASLLSFLALSLLPETLNAKLPETLEEMQTFGRKDKNDQVQLKPLTA